MVKASLTGITLADDWFAIGLSTNDPTRFQGIHAPYVLIVFDEATGVAPEIWDAAEGVAVGGNDQVSRDRQSHRPDVEFKNVSVIRNSGTSSISQLKSIRMSSRTARSYPVPSRSNGSTNASRIRRS
jgi:hypothetical protein